MSIVSLDDPLPLSSATAPTPANRSTTSLLSQSVKGTLGKSATHPGNLNVKLRTPLISSRPTDSPGLTNTLGLRAAEAYVRPSPIAVAGEIRSYGFDLRNCTFTLRLRAHGVEPEERTTEISLPDFHFPKDKCLVDVTSGKWTISSDDTDGVLTQRLRWWHLDGEQTIKITGVRKSQATMLGRIPLTMLGFAFALALWALAFEFVGWSGRI